METRSDVAFDDEYQALRDGRAVVELRDWSSISVTGTDRQKFLNNFCTNDVIRLAPGDCCEAFFPNVKGKIIGHGVISCRPNELVFLGAPEQGARLIEHLDRYIIREDVKLLDLTTKRTHLIVNDVIAPGGSVGTISWHLLGTGVGNIIDLPVDQASQLVSMFGERGFVLIGADVFNAARVEAGTPLFGVDFNDNNLPQEVGRDKEAISFSKGCYLGQETVARIDALGHVNQRSATVKFSGNDLPAAGTELLRDGAVVGRVTSAALSPTLNAPIALAMIRRDANAVGTCLTSSVGDCEVVPTVVTA
jgi:folate-binding protein YgfZ